MNINSVVGYTLEAATLFPKLYVPFRREIKKALSETRFGLDELAEKYLRDLKRSFVLSTLSGMLGIKIFDMYNSQSQPDEEKRIIVGQNSIVFIGLNNAVDNVVDRSKYSLDKKVEFMRTVESSLYTGEIPEVESIGERISYLLARLLHQKIIHKDTEQFRPIYNSLIINVAAQFSQPDPLKALETQKDIGAASMELLAVTSELLLGIQNERLRTALRVLGGHYQIIDDLFDIDEDLKEGTNTYPTLIIKSEGDLPEVRRSIKEGMLFHANEILEEGIDFLESQRQIEIFKLLADLYLLRQKLFKTRK